ncbi:hypothetical protein K1719_021828 [Acacia pycnantha]|nr:hypothetical protein K1719_021828 [Acacia pycnantha]
MDMDTSEDPWTVDEDLTLINYIDAHGEGRRWNSLARSAGLKRTGKSCRLRWFNYLRPKVRRAIALQKLKESKQTVEANSSAEENVESNLSKKNGKPLKNKKRKSQLINDKSEKKINRLDTSNEEWIKQIKNKKKRGDNSNALLPPPPLPEEFQTKIIEKCGELWLNQLTHIYHKKLFKTDLNRQHCRISMPLSEMKSFAFLEDEEITLLREGGAIRVPVIHKPMDNPPTELTITFKQWDLHKNDNKEPNAQYVLNGGWYTIVTEDKFEANQTVDIWAFRDHENKLCLAIVRRE